MCTCALRSADSGGEAVMRLVGEEITAFGGSAPSLRARSVRVGFAVAVRAGMRLERGFLGMRRMTLCWPSETLLTTGAEGGVAVTTEEEKGVAAEVL